ncbi:MAG: PEP-CTERM system histidine kinase PrsK [Desulfuromonadales bacterium]|nr:PEP-CTERM system histidine kinase PrsK [Desulfuromonadales bacterium]MDW7756247.1 PEP-CTERM system histidine kinase PrsK [Desulfuromonadales bacterium]
MKTLFILCLGLAIEVLDVLAWNSPGKIFFYKKIVIFLEFTFLSIILLSALRKIIKQKIYKNFSFLLIALLSIVVIFLNINSVLFIPDFHYEKILFLKKNGFYFYVIIILLVLTSLVLIERIYYLIPKSERWSIKFELLGYATILAGYFFYYSQGILYRAIDMNMMPVRAASVLIGLSFVVYSKTRGGTLTTISLSKKIAFQSVVLLFIGLYLIGMALVGEGLRYLGVSSPKTVFFVIALLAGVAVVIVLLSETLRRKLKVFLYKNFYARKYDYREEWLLFTGKLSNAQSENELYRAIISFYCDVFAASTAALYLVDGKGLFRPAEMYRMDVDETFSSDSSLIVLLQQKDWVLNVRDDRKTTELNIHFFNHHEVTFIVPLRFDQRLEGFVVLGRLIDPSEEFTYEDFDLMKVLAKQAVSSLLSFRLAKELSTAQEMAAIGKVSAFVLHDLKNLVSNLGLVVENATEHMEDPAFRNDMLSTVKGTVLRMKGMIARLQNLEEKHGLDLGEHDLFEVAQEGIPDIVSKDVRIEGIPVRAMVDPDEIKKVVLNLVLNALEAGGSAPVVVEVGNMPCPYIRVVDNGCGMSDEFIRHKLFKPFQTTKKKGFGIGLYQCRSLIEAHGGCIEVESELGKGSCFLVKFPAMGG